MISAREGPGPLWQWNEVTYPLAMSLSQPSRTIVVEPVQDAKAAPAPAEPPRRAEAPAVPEPRAQTAKA